MLRSAVVGYGTAGTWHANVLASHPGAELVAVCDPIEANRNDAAEAHDLQTYSDLDALLAAVDVDNVHVCSPPGTHLPLGRTLLKRDVATLVEKPLTANVHEAEELISLRDSSDAPASVIHSKLFLPAVRRAIDRVEDGEIGSVVAATMLFGEPRDLGETDRGDWVFEIPGGELGEGFAHQVYLPLAFVDDLGGDFRVSRQNFGGYDDQIDFDGVTLAATSGDGTQLVTIQAVMSSINEDRLVVYGTDGMLELDVRRSLVRVTGTGHETPSPTSSFGEDLSWLTGGFTQALRAAVSNLLTPIHRRRGNYDALSGHHAQIDRWIRAVSDDDPPPVSLEEGLETVRAIEAIGAKSERQRQ